MSSQIPIGRALSGAFALARFDRAGMDYFDLSHDGFWRSFNAIAVCLPAVFAAAALTPEFIGRLVELDPALAERSAAYPGNVVLYLIFETIGFMAGWAFFPVAMIWVARMLNMGHRYVPLIIAYNWSRVLITYAVSLPMILFALGMIGAGLLSFIWFVVFIYLLAYRWFVIRAATDASGLTALGLVLLDVLGTVLVQSLIGQIYWAFDSGAPVTPGNI